MHTPLEDRTRAGAWPPLGAILARHRRARPGAPALVGPWGVRTYGELDERTDRLAHAVAGLGVAPGDRVAVLSENSPEYVEWVFALAKLGAVCVPLNVRLSPGELLHILTDAEVVGLVAGRYFHEPAARLAAELGGLRLQAAVVNGDAAPPAGFWSHEELVRRGAGRPLGEVDADRTLLFLYTSGTTGRPKGCMLSQRAWVAQDANLAMAFGITGADVYLSVLPYFHVAGFGMMLAHLHQGGAVLPVPRWDPELAVHLAARYGCTVTFLVPPMVRQFVEHAPASPPRLRAVVGGAGFEPPDLIASLEERFGATFYGIYGQTEAGNIVTAATGAEIRAHPGTYGSELPLFAARIVDDRMQDVAEGEVGELVLRGPTVMDGYWKQEEATREAFAGGWLHTGDLFVREGGRLRMVDRKKYLIKTGGENVYPQEVELVLLRHPAVADAAVVGVPDPHWGETVKAFVALKPGASASGAELSDWVRRHLAAYKRPRYVEFVPEIPRNHSGKVLKEVLRTRPVLPEQRVE